MARALVVVPFAVVGLVSVVVTIASVHVLEAFEVAGEQLGKGDG